MLLHMVPDSLEEFKTYLEVRYAEAHAEEEHHDEEHAARLLRGGAARLLGGGDEDSTNPYQKLINYPWATLVIGLTTTLLVAIDRTIVAHGMHGEAGSGDAHDHHGHDHVSKAFTDMQVAEEKEREKANAAAGTGGDAALLVPAPAPPTATPYGDVARAVQPQPEADALAIGQCDKAAVLPEPAARRDAALRAFVFFFAMSIHSIMDGLSMGTKQDLKSFYAVLVAVLAHKAFDGIALGVPVYLAQMGPLATWGSLLVCAFMTPLGIGIGWAAVEGAEGPQATLASAIIVSISAGSFLYISMMELLPASLHDGRLLPHKFLGFVLGFTVMAVLAPFV
jgi:zinc transporter ZupT